MQKFLFLVTVLTFFGFGPALAQDNPDIAKRNKALFDQTVEKVNFRTIEFVYDRKFPRKKFPANQSDFKTRRTFDDFEGNAAFKKLFMNYNDVSEKFKNKFGKGSRELAAFEKALNDILINKDFEFFISSLNKDDKILLIRSLQQINKKGVAQFVDAAGKPRGFFDSDSVSEETVDPIVKPKNATTTVAEEEVVAEGDTAEPVINTAATPEEVFQQKSPRRDYLSWLALLFSIGALALAASIKLKDVPEVRAFIANNYQKRGDSPVMATKPVTATATETATDPALKKKLDNLTREVEGLYAQMDELIHKNAVLEQKLAGTHPKPFDLPKTAYFDPETEPVKPAENVRRENTVKPVAPAPAAPNVASTPAPQVSNPTPALASTAETNIAPVQPAQEPETPKSYSSFAVAQVPTAPATAAAPKTLYLGKPDQHGFFWNEEVTTAFVPNRSLFVLSLAENNAGKGTFKLVNDPLLQKPAFENPELYLHPVCDVLIENPEGRQLETLAPGTIILNGDQWVLVKKATVRVV